MVIHNYKYQIKDDFTQTEIRHLKYSVDEIFNLKEITRSERDILFSLLNLWRTHWKDTGYIAKDRMSMSKHIKVRTSVETVKRAYSKFINKGILVPVWAEKGGCIATRYIISSVDLYRLSGGRIFTKDNSKLKLAKGTIEEINTGENVENKVISYRYDKEVISNIMVLQKCQTGSFCPSYIYKQNPVSTLKLLTYELRKLGLVSHYQYIKNAFRIVTGKEISLKQIYKIEQIENKNELKKVDRKKTFCERLAEFNESISQPMQVEYEGGFAEIRS